MGKKTETATEELATATAAVPKEKKGDSSAKKASKAGKGETGKSESNETRVKSGTKEAATATATATANSNVVIPESMADDSVPPAGSKSSALFIDMQARLQQIHSVLTILKADMKAYSRLSAKETKNLEKSSGRKNKKNSTTRSPSGFVKPTPISDELAIFLNKEKGIEMARTDVTREINAYIRAHSLQDRDNGRKINADSKLSKLLKLEKSDELTYFNLQKFMSRHFQKAVPKESAPNAVVAN